MLEKESSGILATEAIRRVRESYEPDNLLFFGSFCLDRGYRNHRGQLFVMSITTIASILNLQRQVFR